MDKLFKFLSVLCIISLLFSLSILLTVNRFDHKEEHFKNEELLKNLSTGRIIEKCFNKQTRSDVYVLSKANIGQYFWHHILNGSSHFIKHKLWQIGIQEHDCVFYKFYAGPGLIQTTAPKAIEFMVLILNGRTAKNVASSQLWLNYLTLFPNLQKVGVILLGSETCDNKWILPYMDSNGGRLAFVFLIYDSPLVDNKDFFQWPLGVAEYRGFPRIDPAEVDVFSRRQFTWNFIGTVYKNSSRELLWSILKTDAFKNEFYFSGRNEWPEEEKSDSMEKYINTLKNSDLTLCPVGKNSECYRIYEAIALGSIPIVENVVTPGYCSKSSNSPLRLLKKYNAPLIYVDDWNSIVDIIKTEMVLGQEKKIRRRINIINWYLNFKRHLKLEFFNIVQSKFLINTK